MNDQFYILCAGGTYGPGDWETVQRVMSRVSDAHAATVCERSTVSAERRREAKPLRDLCGVA